MNEPSDTTRPLMAIDYQTIYALIEGGTPLEAIVKVYPLTIETLKKRLSAERPDLWKRFKALTTSVRVEKDDAKRAMDILRATAEVVKLDLSEIVRHDIGVYADRARKQRAAKEKDPQVELTPVGIQDARAIGAHMKSLGMLPESGLQTGGASVNIDARQISHAAIMRRGDDKGILASDDEIAGAVIEVETEQL